MQKEKAIFKINLITIWAILLLLFLSVGCVKKTEFKQRLTGYYQLIGSENRTRFEKGELDKVTASLEEMIASDAAAAEAFDELKKSEAIHFFSPKQTTDFFYYSVYKRIYN